MITGKDINPKKKIYYLGGITLQILKEYPSEDVPFFDVFQKLNEKERISINLYTLTLDWLFLLGVITLNKGGIKKCF
jgi:hypothetical protein